jgi:hypothetical protein
MYYDCQWDGPARPSWLTRRLIARVSAAILAAAVLALGTLTWWTQRPEPFGVARPEVVYSLFPLKGDQKFHMGVAEIDAEGKDVTVLEVTPLISDNVEFLGAVTTYGMDNFQGGPGAAGTSFPPSYLGTTTYPIGEFIPAFKTSYIPKGSDKPAPIVVTAGFRLKSGDDGGVNGVRIVYRTGNKTQTEIVRYAIVACQKPCQKAAKADPDHDKTVLRSHGLLPAED